MQALWEESEGERHGNAHEFIVWVETSQVWGREQALLSTNTTTNTWALIIVHVFRNVELSLSLEILRSMPWNAKVSTTEKMNYQRFMGTAIKTKLLKMYSQGIYVDTATLKWRRVENMKLDAPRELVSEPISNPWSLFAHAVLCMMSLLLQSLVASVV